MKRTIGGFAGIVLLGVSLSLSAAALDATQTRRLVVDGFGQSLGTISVLPLGRVGFSCSYLGIWESPVNPNEVMLCNLRERITPLHPSCVLNRSIDITSVVTAGPGAPDETACSGFDLLGTAVRTDDVTVLLAERTTEPALAGIVLFPVGIALPLIGVRLDNDDDDGEDDASPPDPRQRLIGTLRITPRPGGFGPASTRASASH